MKTQIYFCKTCGESSFHTEIRKLVTNTQINSEGSPVSDDVFNMGYVECTNCGERASSREGEQPDITHIAELREWKPAE